MFALSVVQMTTDALSSIWRQNKPGFVRMAMCLDRGPGCRRAIRVGERYPSVRTGSWLFSRRRSPASV